MILNGVAGGQFKELWNNVKNILSGKIKVGSAASADSAASAANAEKLGGNSAEYYAAASELTKVITGNTTVGMAATAKNAYTASGYYLAVSDTDVDDSNIGTFPNNTIVFVKKG